MEICVGILLGFTLLWLKRHRRYFKCPICNTCRRTAVAPGRPAFAPVL